MRPGAPGWLAAQPTLIAQQLFRPAILDREESEALGEEDLSVIHRTQTPARGPGG